VRRKSTRGQKSERQRKAKKAEDCMSLTSVALVFQSVFSNLQSAILKGFEL
jgi:hypothetical protein